MIDDSMLDAIDKRLTPLVKAISRAVLGAAALEKVLLVDFLHLSGRERGLRVELEQEHVSRTSHNRDAPLHGQRREDCRIGSSGRSPGS
jgi:hypothetical protein